MQQPIPHTFIKVVRDAGYIELSKSRLPCEEVSKTLGTVCAGVSRFSPRARAGSFPVTLGSSRLHFFFDSVNGVISTNGSLQRFATGVNDVLT